MVRCTWCQSTEKIMVYHDCEWGFPVHEDDKIFEYLLLDSFQAGLNWSMILNKR
jgi:DNA-3-methyladenine glycosylase I